MDKPQSHKLKLPLLILVIVLVLGGGGFAIWMVTKKEDEQTIIQEQEGAELPPVSGRTDVTNLYTEEELAFSGLVDETAPDYTPEYTAVLMNSTEGKGLIEDRIRKIQQNKKDADFIRAKHKVGRTLVGNSAFSTKANKEIEKMFGLVDKTVAGNYLTYPVYGKYETDGATLRADIDNFLSKDGQGYNMSMKRHGGNRWWFGSVGLNLMYGSKNAYVHSADQIWWAHIEGDKGRKGLDFYKVVYGHDVSDKQLLEMKLPNGKKVYDNRQINLPGVTGIFAAWGMVDLVKKWKNEIDYFNKVTKEEAVTALEREGLIRRF
jgi:hypothetical protein